MASGGGREEIDVRIRQWELTLEQLRLALACAPEEVHAKWNPDFVTLYRQKEVLKSAWEAIRGIYRPEPEALHHFEKELAAMEAAWAAAQPMLAEALAHGAA